MTQITDADRLDFIEKLAKKSRTGVSIDWSREDGYRVMSFHQIHQGARTAREAIDIAMIKSDVHA